MMAHTLCLLRVKMALKDCVQSLLPCSMSSPSVLSGQPEAAQTGLPQCLRTQIFSGEIQFTGAGIENKTDKPSAISLLTLERTSQQAP